MSDSLKQAGNAAFAQKDFKKAVELFSQAIEIDPKNQVLYSNRSGAYASLKEYSNALKDAETAIEIKPDWVKGYTRKATALQGLQDYALAREAYNKALEIDPSNAQAKSGLSAIEQSEKTAGSGEFENGIASMLSSPDLWGKLVSNPKTAPLLQDPAFVTKLKGLIANPSMFQSAMMSDHRLMSVFAVALGLDFDMAGGPGATGAAGNTGSQSTPASQPSHTPNTTSKQPEPKPTPKEDDTPKEVKEANEEKLKGNAAYKKRDFDTAIGHYNKAWELNKDITYLNNLAAVYFEQGLYEKTIKTCEEAIERGREMRADYKLVAKSFARIGTTYEKMGETEKAITNYNKSLTEHRTPEVLSKLRAAEKYLKQKAEEAYIDPEKAEEAREEGNVKFKAADWPGAVKAYTEMIKRAPQDPRGYSNRAAALAKLLSFPDAVKDCDIAISKDPLFVKAYIRKANCYIGMKDYSKAIEALNEATDQDKTGAHTAEIQSIKQRAMSARFAAFDGETEEQTMERISKDPEVVKILQDPVMNSILSQARENPAALNDHMRNPEVRRKIELLTAAGVIRMR